jgi:RHS repeat-associated protein
MRVKKVDGGATTLYLRSTVLGGQVVAELNGSGTFTRGYVYLGGQLLAVQQSGAVNWVHEDPITKSKRVTNSSGSLVSAIELDPWGADAGVGWVPGFQPKKFTSYERDGNGSDEAMFRRFNRWHSRFDQPDPYEGSYDLTNPQSFNRYSYVQNDPVNFTDPTGLLPAQCNGTIVTDPTTGQSTCIPIISGGTVTITAGPISIQDDPTTYRFVLGSIFPGFGGGRQVGGGAGPQNPVPTSPPTPTPDRGDPRNPCSSYNLAEVLREQDYVARKVGGRFDPKLSTITRLGNANTGQVVKRFQSMGFQLFFSFNSEHPGANLEWQWMNGEAGDSHFYHVTVEPTNYLNQEVRVALPGGGEIYNRHQQIPDPNSSVKRVTIHCDSGENHSFQHLWYDYFQMRWP